MTKCRWPQCIEEGYTPLARQFQSCYGDRPYDAACTQDDRDRIRAAALERAAQLTALAEHFERKRQKLWEKGLTIDPQLLEVAAQLRQLAEGV
jgi:hypothetical protein